MLSKKYKTLLVDADPQGSATWWVERGNMPFDPAQETDANLLKQLKKIKDFELVVVDTPASA